MSCFGFTKIQRDAKLQYLVNCLIGKEGKAHVRHQESQKRNE